MLKPLEIHLEFPRSHDAERTLLEIARDFGLVDIREWRSSEDDMVTFKFRVRERRGKVEALAGELDRYLGQTGASVFGCCVSVYPPVLRARVVAGNVLDWFSRLWWALRHPHDPARPHDLYILKYEATEALRGLLPFQRCRDCKGFTRILWRPRDPHYRNGRWVGPDDCLPF